ncbi:MAG: ABC transporter ATP-binding protein [Syntrophomonadaceae bacterium]|nr:ABC transporter ATP-binding protein [Syntrophomonadaceae bacterium]
MDKIIEVSGLKKSYGDVKAVRDISFYVERGKLFSFLGPNGAGKSTTIDIICTLLACDGGEVNIDGYRLGENDDEIRGIIGVVFQDSVLDSLLTVKENLTIRAGFYIKNKEKIKQSVLTAARATGIMEFIDRPYGKLSGGQRRRADIARALLNTPKILFLDEPTTGLDPQTRKNVWDTIENLKNETGMTVFLTTHYMEEAAKSDYVIVIDNGEIAAKGTPAELKEKYTHDILKLSFQYNQEIKVLLDGLGADYIIHGNEAVIRLPSTLAALEIIDHCKAYISNFEVLRGTMDDAFIAITGKEIRT